MQPGASAAAASTMTVLLQFKCPLATVSGLKVSHATSSPRHATSRTLAAVCGPKVDQLNLRSCG